MRVNYSHEFDSRIALGTCLATKIPGTFQGEGLTESFILCEAEYPPRKLQGQYRLFTLPYSCALGWILNPPI